MERMIQARLLHFLETRGLLNQNQADFRKGRSTMDQIVHILQATFDAFDQTPPHRSILAMLDFTKAYDRVWRDALLHKMDKLGIPTCNIKWTKSLTYDRRSRVRWNAVISKSRVFQEGLPQGSVLAPLPWLIYINDISEGCSSKALWSLFADDTGILATARSLK